MGKNRAEKKILQLFVSPTALLGSPLRGAKLAFVMIWRRLYSSSNIFDIFIRFSTNFSGDYRFTIKTFLLTAQ